MPSEPSETLEPLEPSIAQAEAFSELSEAKRVSARAREERELAHQQSMEAERFGRRYRPLSWCINV